MIDQDIRKYLRRQARACFEQIAPDFLESGQGCAEDAVEPTLWQMQSQEDKPELRAFLEDYRHAARQELLDLILVEVKGYF